MAGVAALLFRRALRSLAPAPGATAVLMLWLMIGLVGVGTSALVSFPFQQPIAILRVVAYLAILSLLDARVRRLAPREVKLPSSRPVRLESPCC